MATNHWCCGATFTIFLLFVHLNIEAATKQNEDFFQFENNSLDISILKSKNEKFLIYRNTGKKECYVERVTIKNSEDEQNSRTLYVGQEPLKKSDKIYTELDDDTKNFCNQFAIFVLQEQPPTYITNGKRRRKRGSAQMPKKPHYRGQTQMQNISFNGGRGNQSGEPTQLTVDSEKSKTIVSGKLRLEQSQSQFESFDCSECTTSWPHGSQTSETSKYPISPEVKSNPTRQSNQLQPGRQHRSFTPVNPPSGVYPGGEGMSYNIIPGQQIIPQSGTDYQANRNMPVITRDNQFYNPQQPLSHHSLLGFKQDTQLAQTSKYSLGSSPMALPSGNITYPQPSAYFIPSSPPTQGGMPQTSQPDSASMTSYFQVPGSGSQSKRQLNFGVNSQTASVFPPNYQTNFEGFGGSIYPQRPQFHFLGFRPQNSSVLSLNSQPDQYFPVNTLPTGQYNAGYINNSPNTPGYFSLTLQPSQQYTQTPQYFIPNIQPIHPQKSDSIITYSERPSYLIPAAQHTQQLAQTFSQIPSNGQVMPQQGSYHQTIKYFPPSPQNTQQSGYSKNVINSQTHPSNTPSLQVPQQGSEGAAYFPFGLKSTLKHGFSVESTNPQSTVNVSQTNHMIHERNSGAATVHPQISTNFPSVSQSQLQPDSVGGLIYCQSCSYIPAKPQLIPQHTGGTTINSLPSHQGSGQFQPILPQNSEGLQPQTQLVQFPIVSHPISADNSHHTIPQQQTSQFIPGQSIPSWSGYENASPSQTNQSLSKVLPYPYNLPISSNSPFNQNYPLFNYVPQVSNEPQNLSTGGMGPSTTNLTGLTPQISPNQYFPAQGDLLSQNGHVADPNYPFQTQYIPQTYEPHGQPQIVPTGTQINQSESFGGHPNQNYPHVESPSQVTLSPFQNNSVPVSQFYSPTSKGQTPIIYPQETYLASKNCTNRNHTIQLPSTNQNGGTVYAAEDDIIEDALSVSSINIVNNATRAEAISQAKTKNSIVIAEVSGTYTKDFAAKAQTIDNEKSAISQIFGNATGAMSTSFSRAGKSESQSQILFSHETGSAIAESQGGGMGYNLTGQIQVGIRGGQANSQATGPGSTFSEAQIGVVPTFKENFLQKSIFQGGGTVSSNINRHSGLTDIKFQGQFKSGPLVTGQVQVGAGRLIQNKTRISFNSTNLTNLSQKDPTSTTEVNKTAEIIIQEEKNDAGRDKNATHLKLILPQPSTNNSLDTLNDFGTQTSNLQKRLLNGQFSNNQKSVQSSKNNMVNNVDPSSNKFLYAGEIIPGTKNYRVPSGFRGRFLPEDVQPSDTRTSITNYGRMTEIDYSTPSKQGKVYIQKDNFENQQHYVQNGYDGYMTVTKSETGELRNKDWNYNHTYYTKSSTCGYFTYTCNVIDGPDGRTKICKQGSATDANGTPC